LMVSDAFWMTKTIVWRFSNKTYFCSLIFVAKQGGRALSAFRDEVPRDKKKERKTHKNKTSNKMQKNAKIRKITKMQNMVFTKIQKKVRAMQNSKNHKYVKIASCMWEVWKIRSFTWKLRFSTIFYVRILFSCEK